MMTFSATRTPPLGGLPMPQLRRVVAFMFFFQAVLFPGLPANGAGGAIGPADGQGVFDVTSTVPPGHGTGRFELSLDSAFGWDVRTIAGQGMVSGAANGDLENARFDNPGGVARDNFGNLFVVDSGNSQIRMITAEGVVTTIAGSDYGFVDSQGPSAKFAIPTGIAVGPQDQNVYVADTYNHRIRKLTRPAVVGQAWVVTTLAGGNLAGFLDATGSSARFSFPQGLVVDGQGAVYVADSGSHRIRKVTALGVVTTLAGNGNDGFVDGPGVTAEFSFPGGIVIDSEGNFFVADRGNHSIRRVLPTGVVSTYAGSGGAGSLDGNLLSATFNAPAAIAIDPYDTLYVSDEGSHLIRRVTPPTRSPSIAVQTVAGSGTAGYLDARAGLAQMNYPAGMAVMENGDLWVADSENHCLRAIISPIGVAAVGNLALPNVKATINPVALNIPPGVYYFRWRASDWTVENDGLSRFITTVTPIAKTTAPEAVNAGEVTLKGLVNPQNLPVRILKFEIAQDETFASSLEVTVTPVPGAGTADVPFSFVYDYPTDTQVGTEFFYRAIAINDYGTSVATEVFSFTVPSATVVTDPVTDALTTRYAAQLSATVNPVGSSLTVSFDYSTEPELEDSWLVSTVVAAPGAGGANGAAIDSMGEVYFSRSALHRIDKVSGGTSIGTGDAGFVDGSFATAKFDRPAGVAIYQPNPSTKWLYVCDEFNHCVRKVDLITGTVTTLAGSTIAGYADGLPTAARFLYPTGIAVDQNGHVYVADTGNHCIRRIEVIGGLATSVSTLTGTNSAGQLDGEASAARFQSPRAIVFAADGSLYIADTGNHRVCKLSGGVVSTVAGGGGMGYEDAVGAGAKFSSPSGLAIDPAGRVLVADPGNHRIRRIGLDDRVITLAGSGIEGVLDSPVAGTGLVPATATRFVAPNGLTTDGGGNFWITGAGDAAALRKISPGSIQTVTVVPDVTGTIEQSVSQMTMTLSPGTTYYYRAVGNNRMDGTVDGEIRSFTTYTEPAIAVHDGGTTQSLELQAGQIEAVNFGVMARSTMMMRSFTIANSGGWPMTVSGVTVPSGYTLIGGAVVVPVGGSTTFQVILTDTDVGIYSGVIEITSDDPDVPLFVFPITGKKVDPPIITSVSLKDLSLMPSSATLVADVDPNGADTSIEFEVSPGPDFEAVRVTTPAGGVSGYLDGPGSAARFDGTNGVATDTAGNVYVADTMNHRIRRVTPSGVVSTIAGSGLSGFADGPASEAQFDRPVGIAVGADGVIFVSDNHRIRVIANGQVTTFAGTGEPSFTDGLGAAARFHSPMGIAIDQSGILYVADRENRRIRKVESDGAVSTLVNFGGSTQPTDLTVGENGVVYVVDAGNHMILSVTTGGVVSPFAGTGQAGFADGVGTAAEFDSPSGLDYDEVAKVFYVADRGNERVRKINLSGVVTTLAGSGETGLVDGPGLSAAFDEPVSVAVLREKTLIVGQLGGSAIRQVTPTVIRVSSADLLTASGEYSLAVAGLDPGVIHYFRLVVNSVGGRVVSAAQLLGTAFTQWQIDQFGEDAVNPAIAGPEASPSGDKISNLMKYALGLDPEVRVHAGLPLLRVNHPTPGFFSLTINRNPAATNVRFFFEGSTDKVRWSTDDVQLSGDSVGFLPYKDVPKRFLRLGLELLLP